MLANTVLAGNKGAVVNFDIPRFVQLTVPVGERFGYYHNTLNAPIVWDSLLLSNDSRAPFPIIYLYDGGYPPSTTTFIYQSSGRKGEGALLETNALLYKTLYQPPNTTLILYDQLRQVGDVIDAKGTYYEVSI